MKKLLILGSTFAMGLCAVGIAVGVGQAKEAEATTDDLVAVLDKYIDENGQYTKKTAIYLNEETKEDMKSAFHAGHNVLERTTYYDETADALLMGDYDGGFDDINSGYAAKGQDMVHYSYKGDAAAVADYFKEGSEYRKEDYTVKSQTPNVYFFNLSRLGKTAKDNSASWSKEGNVYKHQIKNLELVNGEYNDPSLKAFQYFAAPMLLQGKYFSYDRIEVQEAASFLSIRLFVTSSDADKVTVQNASNYLLSEARVFKGLSANPEAKVFLKGHFNDWGESDPLVYDPDASNPEQYKLVKELTSTSQGFKVTYYDEWYGKSQLENPQWFNGDDDIYPKFANSFTFYFKPTYESNKLYIGINGEEVTMTIDEGKDWAFKDNAVFYVWAWGWMYEDGGEWVGPCAIDAENLQVSVHMNYAYRFILVRMNPEGNVPSWDEGTKWSQTGDVDYTYGTGFVVDFL